MTQNRPSECAYSPLLTDQPRLRFGAAVRLRRCSIPMTYGCAAPVMNSGNGGNPGVDERYLPAAIPGWAQSRRVAALHLVIEALTDLLDLLA